MLTAFTLKKNHVETYKIDTNQSTLEWYAEKVGGKHNGTIKISGGEVQNNHGNLTGSVEIDMTTIEDKDITKESSKAKLESHLKSADFFDVAKYPKSKFVITSVTPIKESKIQGATHNIKGMLTIKDKTNEIMFDAEIKIDQSKISCIGSAVVDRSKFDIKYGSKTFFEDIGDKMIYDEFTLKLNVIATKQ